jgi:hypothetical protein
MRHHGFPAGRVAITRREGGRSPSIFAVRRDMNPAALRRRSVSIGQDRGERRHPWSATPMWPARPKEPPRALVLDTLADSSVANAKILSG